MDFWSKHLRATDNTMNIPFVCVVGQYVPRSNRKEKEDTLFILFPRSVPWNMNFQ